jgi:hypothetical protein
VKTSASAATPARNRSDLCVQLRLSPPPVSSLQLEGDAHVPLIEFRRADGTVTTVEVQSVQRYVRGDVIEHDGNSWVMYDRVDRDGVTVHLFAPAPEATPSSTDRGRSAPRRRSVWVA